MPVDQPNHHRAAVVVARAPIGRWMPVVAGAGVLAVVIIAGVE
jgi:hypothetical protein